MFSSMFVEEEQAQQETTEKLKPEEDLVRKGQCGSWGNQRLTQDALYPRDPAPTALLGNTV